MGPAAEDCPYETGSGGGGSEAVSDGDVVLSADERKRTAVGYGKVVRRRSLGDHKRRRWSAVSALSFLE